MFNGLNNKLANVPTITGLSNVTADEVITDDLVINGIDVGDAISDLQQLTTGITYNSGTDTTTVDNNVAITKTLNVTGNITAPYLDGTARDATTATNVTVTSNNDNVAYYPTFVTSNGTSQSILVDNGTTPLTYNPASSTLTDEITYSKNYAQCNKVYIGSKNTQSTFIVINALGMAQLTTGDFNTCVGGQIFYQLRAGSNNFGMGYNCMNSLRNSSNNCGMGHRALLGLNASGTTTAYFNTGVGDSSLTNGDELQFCVGVGAATGGGMLTGTFNTCIGGAADCGNALSYATAIGGQAVVTTSNTVQLGRSADNTNISGTLSIQNTGLEGTTVAIFRNTDTVNGTPAKDIRFMPNASGGDFNPYTSLGDSVIWGHSTSADTQALNLTIWSATSNGIRISPTRLQLGWGGTSSTPTNALTFDTTGTRFNTVPKTSVAPSVGDDLCNKTYVDAFVPLTMNISDTNSSGTYYPVLVDGVGTKSLQIDSGLTPLTYTPITGTLTTTTFNGALTGNATTATTATNVVATTNNTNATYYPTFVDGNGASKGILVDDGTTPFTYNPSTNTLSGLQSITSGAAGTNSLVLESQSTNTNPLIIRHNASNSNANILIHTSGLPVGGSIALRTNGASGKGLNISVFGGVTLDYQELYLGKVVTSAALAVLGFGGGTDNSNWISGFNSSRTIFNANTNNTIYGNSIGINMDIAAVNNTLVGTAAGNSLTNCFSNTFVGSGAGAGTTTGSQNTFIGTGSGFKAAAAGTGNNNTCVGYNTGNAMTTTANANTLVGSFAGDLITTGINNSVFGTNAAGGLLTGDNNTFIGNNAGSNVVSSSNNICIGNGSTVPVAGNSNQIALGGTADTVFIRGGFRFKPSSAAITGTSTLPLAPETILASIYVVNIASTGQTVTLPDPANYAGHMVIFKRITTNVQYTLASGGVAPRFLPLGTITLATTITVTTSIFQQIFVSASNNWCEISRT
jgi:hypothetical protein